MLELDHNATTKPSPGVVEAVSRGLTEFWHNPSSVHRSGQAARRQVELAREYLAALIGPYTRARPRDLVFTSGGTEAIDLCIRGVLLAAPRPPASEAALPTLVTTPVEHAAVRDLAKDLEKSGMARVVWAPLLPDSSGLVDVDALDGVLGQIPKGGPRLLSVQWVNNETGAIQSVERISALCRAHAFHFHCDATQWVGKETADLAPGLFDLLTFAPHKFHGPKGVGVAYIAPGVKYRPRLMGSQELGRRGGTENVPGIMGAGVAALEAAAWLAHAAERPRLAALRDRFEAAIISGVVGLAGAGVESARVNGPRDPKLRLWNTTNIAFPRLEAEALLLQLSERGVNASAGAACSSGSLEPSPVLLAMGIPPELAHGSIRFSFGRDATSAMLDEAAGIVVDAARRLRGSTAGVVA